MKIILSLLLLSVPTFIFSQQKTDTTKENKQLLPYYIETCTDKMTDKSYAFGSKVLICSDNGKTGFSITTSFDYKNNEVTYTGLHVRSVGIGNCVENSTLIFLFEDDTKEQIGAWNKFNCEGNSYMDWKGAAFNKITQKKIKAIRFQNGRTYDSYTYNLPAKEQSFFIEVASALKDKRIVTGSCDD